VQVGREKGAWNYKRIDALQKDQEDNGKSIPTH